MRLHIYKYQGAGNDFLILDNRENLYNLNIKEIEFLCNRKFGIGADGLMLLEKSNIYDFSMKVFNSDGLESTMCGNGGRCLVAFAHRMGLNSFCFEAIDGEHSAKILEYSNYKSVVELKMGDVTEFKNYSNTSYFIKTGSPHYIEFVDDVANFPLIEKGKYWRYHKDFEGGTNANFVEILDDKIFVRTYERGVEDETLACGTGVTASAIATYLHSKKGIFTDTQQSDTQADEFAKYNIKTLGGSLNVSFTYNKKDNIFTNVLLTGPATFVFECEIEI